MNLNIKVSWIETKDINVPDYVNSIPTKEEVDNYKNELRASECKKYGTIVEFLPGALTNVIAVIITEDNKIIKKNINYLTVENDKK